MVTGSDPSTRTQALGIIAAAQRVFPESLDEGRVVRLMPDINAACFAGLPAGAIVYGCIGFEDIFVKWPHPSCGHDDDLTCSALAHELCHAATGMGDGQADACALIVNLEYRKSLP